MEHFVQNHLTQSDVAVANKQRLSGFYTSRKLSCSLGFNARHRLPNLLCYMSKVNYRIRFQHSDQVLLEQRVVEMSQMSPDKLVMLQF